MSINQRAILWLLLVILGISCFYWKTHAQLAINTDLLDLLPEEEQDPLTRQAHQQLIALQQQQVFWLIGASTPEKAKTAAQELSVKLLESHLFEQVQHKWQPAPLDQLKEKLLPFRFQLLGEKDSQIIQQRASSLLHPPHFNPSYSTDEQGNLSTPIDPLGLYDRYLKQFQMTSHSLNDNAGIIPSNQQFYAALKAKPHSPDFHFEQEPQLMSLWQTLNDWADSKQYDLKSSGYPLYRAYGITKVKSEIRWITSLSLLGVFILTTIIFRSLRPVFLVTGVVLIGIATGWMSTALIFGDVHIMTLIFGSIVVCITADYAYQFLCDSFHPQWTPQTGLDHIFPALRLGLVSSVFAYLSLSIAPSPGLQEMAFFCAAGLTGSWLTVFLLLPFLMQGFHIKDPSKPSKFVAFLMAPGSPYRRQPISDRTLVWSTIGIVLFCIPGISKLNPTDHIRFFDAVPTPLKEDNQWIKTYIPQLQELPFFLVTGHSPDDVLLREEALIKQLNVLKEDQIFKEYEAISPLVPSRLQQQKNQQLVRQLLSGESYSNTALNKQLPLQSIGELHKSMNLPFKPLTINTLIKEEQLPVNRASLWLDCQQQRCGSLVLIYGTKEAGTLKQLAQQQPHVEWVDRHETVTQMLSEYRQFIILLLCCALIIAATVIGIFTQLSHAVHIMLVPSLSILISLAVLGYFGIYFSLFNLLALLIILGVGIDYALFYRLSEDDGLESTVLSITLAAITTLLAVGTLVLSDTPMIRAFGITLTSGLISAYLLALFFGRQGLIDREHHQQWS